MTENLPTHVPPPSFPPGRGFAPKPGLDGKGDLHDPKKAGRQHRRSLASPCDRPPSVPTGVRMKFRAVEAKTHLNFKGRIVWDDVTTDSSGFTISTVDRWDIEWRALDGDGDPVEVEHSALLRAWNPTAQNFHYKTARAISPDRDGGFEWHVGDRVKIHGCFPETNYNGTFTITAIPASDEFVVDGGHSGEQDAKRVGEVYDLSTSQTFRRKLRNPQPRIALRKATMEIATSDHSGITAAHNPSGTTYRFVTGPTNDYQVGDYVKVEGASPPAYNGIWHVTNRIDADTFEVLGDQSGVAAGTSGDVYIATTFFEFTTRGINGFNNGDQVRVTGCRPEVDYNGTYEVTTTPGDDVFRVRPNRHPNEPLLNAEVLGVVYDHTDALHLLMPHVPRARSWSWQARVRCRSGEGCWSAFSHWTDPILPFDGAEPKPPAPTYGTFPITFDHKGKGKHRKTRLLFTFDEVLNWDVPGGDREEDVKSYTVQLDHSIDGVTWDTTRQGGSPYRTHSRPARDGDADSTVTVVFHNDIHRHYWYRCRVRTIDRFSRRGDWSAWTDPALPFDDDSPPTPVNVEVFPASTDRVVVAWEDPTIAVPCVGTVSGTIGFPTLTGVGTQFRRQVEAGTVIKIADTYADLGSADTYTVKAVTSATSLTLTSDLLASATDSVVWEVTDDPDVAIYAVQIAKFANVDTSVQPNEWSDVYAHDRSEGRRKGFKIKNSDTDETFMARVRSIDAARNRSAWIPAWVRAAHSGDANSDPDADADGVVVVPGGSIVSAEWNYPGRLDKDGLDIKDDDGDTTEHITAPYEIPSRFENQTGIRLYFKNCQLTCGDKEAGTGCPTGTGIIVQMRRWETDEVTAHTLFDASGGDDRPRIGTNDFRGSSNTFQAGGKYVDPGEAVSCTLFQYGATNPGSNLRVQLTMSPAAPVQT